jgi:hypothetical protein
MFNDPEINWRELIKYTEKKQKEREDKPTAKYLEIEKKLTENTTVNFIEKEIKYDVI